MIVIVCAPTAVPRFVKISSIAAADNSQFKNVVPYRKPVPRNRPSARAFEAMSVAAVFTADMTNAGTDCNEEQFWNIPTIVVTAAVSNSGTDCNEEQLKNITDTSVTAAVSNSGTDCNEEQPKNICVMFVTAAVSNSGTDCNEGQP